MQIIELIEILEEESITYLEFVNIEDNLNIQEKIDLLLSLFDSYKIDLLSRFYKSKTERDYSFGLKDLLSLLHIFDFLDIKYAYDIVIILRCYFPPNDEIINNNYMRNYLNFYHKLNNSPHNLFIEYSCYYAIKFMIENNLIYSEIKFYKCKDLNIFRLFIEKNLLHPQHIPKIFSQKQNETNVELMTYLYQFGSKFLFEDLEFENFCKSGNLPMVKFFSENFWVDINYGFEIVCNNGSLNCVEYLCQNSRLEETTIIDSFIFSYQLHILIFLRKKYPHLINSNNIDLNDLLYTFLTEGEYELGVWLKEEFALSDNITNTLFEDFWNQDQCKKAFKLSLNFKIDEELISKYFLTGR